MELLDVARILVGLVLLVGGGELLVRGAAALAVRLGISPLIVGLTVVSIATSAPEFAVTLGAVLDDRPDLAVGNVVGSNIANILFILGIASLVLPLAVKVQLVRFDVPAMVVMSGVFVLLARDGQISPQDGGVLLALIVAHTVTTVVLGKRSESTKQRRGVPSSDAVAPSHGIGICLGLVVVGVALLVGGAQLLVGGAVAIAAGLGISELVIGLTVIAIGTSLPELAASVIAALRGQRDLAVGNVVGSCLANLGLVLGLPAILAADGLPVAGAAIALDLPLMLAAAVALAPVAFTGFVVNRAEGALYLGLYVAYVLYIVLDATGHDALDGFTTVMVAFVLPLVAFTLVATAVFEWRRIVSRRPTTGPSDPPPGRAS